jgi:hypothetical protein
MAESFDYLKEMNGSATISSHLFTFSVFASSAFLLKTFVACFCFSF